MDRRAQRIVLREYRPRLDPAQDPRRAPSAGAKRRTAMITILKANRDWEASRVSRPDRDDFRQRIIPK
jgi:hypothetical protein